MIPQPGTSGDWTVYMTGDETPRIDEVNSAQICITRCKKASITIVIVCRSLYLYKYLQKFDPIESLVDMVTLNVQEEKGFIEVGGFLTQSKRYCDENIFNCI